MSRLSLSCLFLFTPLLLFSQLAPNNYYRANMVSPQVSDMIRYGDVETSLFTGRVNFSIPVYSLEDPDFNLKLSLNYFSDGFKPLKNSGWVGYNWFIQVGGCITREVRNYPDEIYRDIPNISQKAEGMLVFTQRNHFNKEDIFAMNPNSVTDCGVVMSYNVGKTCSSDVDYMPDIFHFNFLGYHGSFMINNTGSVRVVSGDYVDVDLSGIIDMMTSQANGQYPTPNHTSKIIIRTTDGYSYIFGGDLSSLEYTYTLKNGQVAEKQAPPVISSWHLSKVIAPNGRTITYHYKGGSTYLLDSNLLTLNVNYTHFVHAVPNSIPEIDAHIQYAHAKECVLDSICVSGEHPLCISFYSSLARKKYNDASFNLCKKNYRLDSIRISSGDRLLRQCKMSYEYKSYAEEGWNRFNWRFLSGVSISGVGTYSLQYNHRYAYPSLEMVSDNDYSGLAGEYGYWQQSSLQGMLCEVQFPTGGIQRFEFERHAYGTSRIFQVLNDEGDVVQRDSVLLRSFYADGVRINKVETYDNNGLVEKHEFSYNKNGSSLSSGLNYYNLLIYPLHSWDVAFANFPSQYSLLDTHIGYSRVEERISTSTTQMAYKNVYTFDVGKGNFSTYANSSINRNYVESDSKEAFLFSGSLSYDGNFCSHGKLLVVDNYRGNTLLRSAKRRYNGIPLPVSELFPVAGASLGCVDTIVIFSHYWGSPITRKLFIFPDVLEQEIIQEYDEDGGCLLSIRNYERDGKFRLVKERMTDSQGVCHFKKFTYPDELFSLRTPHTSSSPWYLLLRSHQINKPIEVISGYTLENVDYITSGELNLYSSGMYVVPNNSTNSQAPVTDIAFASSFISEEESQFPEGNLMDSTGSYERVYFYPYLRRTLRLSLTSPIDDYQPFSASQDSVSWDVRYDLESEYVFDYMGRPVSIKPYGEPPTTYVWNGMYPLSKTKANQTYMYTFIPHVGVSSITDPRGITTYYLYDSVGRLVETYRMVNNQKQILNSYYYNISTDHE